MTRIRYKKNPDGSIYTDGFKSPTEELFVNITENIATIFNLKGELLHKQDARSLPNAKKAAKKILIALGVPFESEVRSRIEEDKINKDARRQYESENVGDK